MGTFYVSSVDGSNSDNGTTWALAVETLKYAVETLAATGGPHTILVDSAHNEQLAADTTITPTQDVRIISVDRTDDTPLAGGTIGSQPTNYALTFNGTTDVFMYGITARNGTNTSVAAILTLNGADGGHYEFEDCTFICNGATASYVLINQAAQAVNGFSQFKNCQITFAASARNMRVGGGSAEFYGCAFTNTTTGGLCGVVGTGGSVRFEGCDFSTLAGPVVSNVVGSGYHEFVLVNCVISANGFMATPSTINNRGYSVVTGFNCASGDTHYAMFHGDPFGTTTVSDTIYANDGAKYDGTNGCSWVITTRANNCSFFTPYVSPWIDKYHAGTSAITMSLECLRDGNTTVYDNDEVWGESSYQGNTGSTQADFANDRMALLGAPAAQTASTIAWTGATTPGKFKLESGSVTPAEIGHLRARVVVGEPEITVYVDPKIRVA